MTTPEQLDLLAWEDATPARPPTLPDLRARIAADPDLRPTRRRDLLSALNRLESLFGIRPTLPITPALLRPYLNAPPPEMVRKPKAWANLKSCAQAILSRYCAAQGRGGSRRLPLTSDWQVLADRLPECAMRYKLSRFMSFCAREGIAPARVNDATLARFAKHLEADNLTTKPAAILREAVRIWNDVVDTVPGWPARRLTRPAPRPRLTRTWDALPASFVADADRWLDRLATGGDPFGEDDGPARPCRPATITTRRFQIRQAASILLDAGYDVAALPDLLVPERVATIVRTLQARSHVETSATIDGLLAALRAIARHHVQVDDAQLQRLKAIGRRVRHRQDGLTPKNRARLEPFLDERNRTTLIQLPLDACASAARLAPASRARRLRNAAATELLLATGMRLKNLTALNLDAHMRRTGSGATARWTIVVAGDETKTGVPHEYRLGPSSSRVLTHYIAEGRPYLLENAADSGWLFPGGKAGAPLAEATLGRAVTGFVRRHTGLVVNAHLFRHILALINLSEDPASHETVSRLLGHTSTKTTRAHYAGLECHALQARYDSLLEGYRAPIGATQ